MQAVVAALTSWDAEKLDRCLASVPKDMDKVVICNTQDEEYPAQARLVARKHNAHYFTTVSNGTPGRGKQTVLDWFCTDSPHDWLIPIDADDYFFEGGIQKLMLLLHKHQPDAIGLKHNPMFLDGKPTTLENALDNGEFFDAGYVEGSRRNLVAFYELQQTLKQIIPFNRILALSKKGAACFEYTDQLFGSEDIIANVDLYREHCNGNIKYCLTEKEIYMYDCARGSLMKFFQDTRAIIATISKVKSKFDFAKQELQVI